MLAWSMQDAGIDVEALAAATQRDSAVVHDWIHGKAMPTKGDLQKIAKRVGRSLQFFFLDAPPVNSGAQVRFRAAIGGNSQDPAMELTALRNAARLQKIACAAAEEMSADRVVFPARGNNATEYANKIRDLLDWSTQIQINATSKSALFKTLRARIEQLGVVVIYEAMGEKNCRGFSLPDSHAPLIAINSYYRQPALRTFTLLHELAHLAGGVESVCHAEDNQEERWCDEFASSFLLPHSDLQSYFVTKGWTTVTLDQFEDQIRLISNRFKASWQSVALRLRSLHLTDQAVVDRVFAANWDANDPQGFAPSGGRARPFIRFEKYGATFTRAVFSLRSTNRLSELDTRRYLDVNGSELGVLRDLAGGVS